MLTHIVLFSFDDPADADEVAQRLAAMAGGIAEILDLQVGRDVVGSPRSYDVGLIVRLADRAALDVYANHPEHLPVVELVRDRGGRTVVVDFED